VFIPTNLVFSFLFIQPKKFNKKATILKLSRNYLVIFVFSI
jgi:hypothetical protein